MAEIIITGASGGIGSALCKLFLDEGHRVFAISRRVMQTVRHPNLHWMKAELSESANISREVAAWSKGKDLRVLLHNAGYMVRKPAAIIEEADLEELMRVNVIWPWLLTKALLPWLSNGIAGHTIYISSMSGFQGSLKYAGLSAYGASKAAGNAWIESMAAEHGTDDRLYFNALALGAVETPMLRDSIPGSAKGVEVEVMAKFIFSFAMEGFRVMNGRIVPVSLGNP